MPQEAKWALALTIGVGLVWVGWKYTPILVTLHILVCFVLVLVIMLQSGSAADLAGAFGGAGSQTAFGPRGAATLLSKATTWCAIVFMLTSLTLSIKRAPAEAGGSSSILEQTQKSAPSQPKPATPPQAPPRTPAPAPAQTPTQPPAQGSTQPPAQAPAPNPPPAKPPAPRK